MRILCLIFALGVMLLSVKPCCTDTACGYKNTEQASNKADKEKDCSGCSPFFACGTCTGFVVAKPTVYTAKPLTETPVEHLHVYRHPYIELVSLSIWQPPQIG